MALPSQELLNKYRAEEAAAKDKPANPEQTNAETTTTETETQPTGGDTDGSGDEHTDTTPNSSDSNGAQPDNSGKDDRRWEKTQANFEKRLHRQERSHRRTVEALQAQIADLKAKLEGKAPKLKREDFPTSEAFEEYRKEELKKEILEEQQKTQADRDAVAAKNAEAQKKVEQTFRTPEQRQEFNEVLSEFLEDNSEWLETEEGQLYQEIIDQSPVGLLMAMAIGKDAKVQEQMKSWSKDLLFMKLQTFENALLQKAKEKQTQTATPTATHTEAGKQTPAKPTTSGIPSTGAVGKTQAAGKFNAREWLKKNRPERYPLR